MGNLFIAVLIAGSNSGGAGDWLGWRGPTGMGHTNARDLPLTWGGKTADHVLWKAPLFDDFDRIRRDHNQSSPIVSGQHVVVTASYWPAGTSAKAYPEHHVLCFRAGDGKRLWDTRVQPGPWLLSDLRGGYTAPTPASDGQRIYVVFGSAVLAALDFQGNLLWRKEIVPHAFDVAMGVSPVLYGDTVLLLCDQLRPEKASVLLAFDKKTGERRWARQRPTDDWTHGTPVIARINGKAQLLAAAAYALQGLNPETGEVHWWCGLGGGKRTGDTASPVYGSGLVYCDSGRGGPGIAVDPTGSGDVSKTHLRWKIPQVPEGFSSPLIVGPYLYRTHGPETLKCHELATGKVVYSERLVGLSPRVSPVATADGRIYFASAGKSFVVKAGPTFTLLGTSDLGDASDSSPAVAGDCLYLRGSRYLYCIGYRR
ncbi:MAG TPA: PQQ-binding-like beta-propeller repeat protein [Pirellulales bacterium]|nr:PQQ-binding-like beta-propeller repeat protein [Pirellulales bacterium]